MSSEWQGPAIVLSARPHGEAGAVVTLLTEALGRHAGLAKGGASRAQSAVWQPGNLVEARWIARLPDQLGALSGEMVHPAAALAMEDPLALAILAAACATAEAALPEREPHPGCFHDLVALIAGLPAGAAAALSDYIRWEAGLLGEIGYGLALGRCAVTGAVEDLAYVSPRTGRAVSRAAAGEWAGRLLPLPGFLLGQAGPAGSPISPAEALAGLRLTGHFLARECFGDRGLPAPRAMLADRVAGLM